MQGGARITEEIVARAMRYAVHSHPDGSLSLTVFNEGRAASVTLPVPFVEGLARDLEEHLEKFGNRKRTQYEN